MSRANTRWETHKIAVLSVKIISTCNGLGLDYDGNFC